MIIKAIFRFKQIKPGWKVNKKKHLNVLECTSYQAIFSGLKIYTQGYTVYLPLLASYPVTPVHKPLSFEHCLLRIQQLGSDLIM